MSTLTGEMNQKDVQAGQSNLWSKWRDDFVRMFKTAEDLGNKAAAQRETLQDQPVESKWEAMFSRVAENTSDKANNLSKD